MVAARVSRWWLGKARCRRSLPPTIRMVGPTWHRTYSLILALGVAQSMVAILESARNTVTCTARPLGLAPLLCTCASPWPCVCTRWEASFATPMCERRPEMCVRHHRHACMHAREARAKTREYAGVTSSAGHMTSLGVRKGRRGVGLRWWSLLRWKGWRSLSMYRAIRACLSAPGRPPRLASGRSSPRRVAGGRVCVVFRCRPYGRGIAASACGGHHAVCVPAAPHALTLPRE